MTHYGGAVTVRDGRSDLDAPGPSRDVTHSFPCFVEGVRMLVQIMSFVFNRYIM